MIKADAIPHEGSEGPNWVLRCRSVLSSGRVLTITLLVLAALVSWRYIHNHSQAVAHQSKTDSTAPSKGQLDVRQPGASVLQADPTSTVQSNTTATSPSNNRATSSDNSVKQTLPPAQSTIPNNGAAIGSPIQQAGNAVSGVVQPLTQTVDNTTQSVTKTVNGLLNSL